MLKRKLNYASKNGIDCSYLLVDAENAISVLYDPVNITTDLNEQFERVPYEKNADVPIIPASLTKILTAITVINHIQNLNEKFSFKQSDCFGGSGMSFLPGDEISLHDALYAMLLPFSNITAHALARVVGEKIIKESMD